MLFLCKTYSLQTAAKDTFFWRAFSLNCRGRLLKFERPALMGILNITPDSFSDGGLIQSPEQASERAGIMLAEGADIIDIGGVSTRPGAADLDTATELERVIPVVRRLRADYPEAILSVDTWRAAVAIEAVGAGADMINDVSGGDFDPAMHETIASLNVPYIVMHTPGKPSIMQKEAFYENVVTDVARHLSERVLNLRKLGVQDIIIDPGFGFGKTVDHNFTILRELRHFSIFGLPVMVGLSRKSMIGKVLGASADHARNGSTVLHTLALAAGASILRVHDVREAREAIELTGRCLHPGTPAVNFNNLPL